MLVLRVLRDCQQYLKWKSMEKLTNNLQRIQDTDYLGPAINLKSIPLSHLVAGSKDMDRLCVDSLLTVGRQMKTLRSTLGD